MNEVKISAQMERLAVILPSVISRYYDGSRLDSGDLYRSIDTFPDWLQVGQHTLHLFIKALIGQGVLVYDRYEGKPYMPKLWRFRMSNPTCLIALETEPLKLHCNLQGEQIL